MRKVIGGEFDFLRIPKPLKSSSYFDNCQLVSSGRAALYWILKHLQTQEHISRVYLPDYLCDSIYHVCEALHVPYSFYRLDDNLCIDLQCVENRITLMGGGILLIINYFGLVDAEKIIDELKRKNDSIKIVLDNVQAPFSFAEDSKAVFTFTSLRKAFPVPDGGLIKNKELISTSFESPNRFSQYKIAASYLKHLRKEGYYDDDIYLDLYEKGERIMDEDYQRSASKYTEAAYKHIDIERFAILRKRNSNHLVSGLKRMGLEPYLNITSDKVPLFVPVVLENRDKVRKALFKNGIFCPVHWPVTEHLKELERGRYMEAHELSIIIDHRYSLADMDRILNIIADNI